MKILFQYRDDVAWLNHQLEQRHPTRSVSLRFGVIRLRLMSVYKEVLRRLEDKTYPTEHDLVMDRRMCFLYAIERELGLKGPYG